eukprot:6409070-Amphidinium_carterae.2
MATRPVDFSSSDHYHVLGVPRGASESDITKAYKAVATFLGAHGLATAYARSIFVSSELWGLDSCACWLLQSVVASFCFVLAVQILRMCSHDR